MDARPAALAPVRFDRFELQPQERRLLVDGQPASLGARALDLLLALVSRNGRLASKSELMDEVWPGLVVEEANLSVQVSTLRKVLGGNLIATIPGRGYRFTGQIEAMGQPPASTVTADPAAPPIASATPPAPRRPLLIGRDVELEQAALAMAEPGCLTLVGPAGVGKTTLARALAARSAEGAVWVDLAPLADGGQVLPALARVLGIAEPEHDPIGVLTARLGARLLVLDNAEHVIDAAAALVAQLFQSNSALRVLATSQLRLAVAQERVHRLEPLTMPLGDDTLDLHLGAVALFVDRARAADHRFQARPEHLPLLREICRRLDGLPLALEMAAARVPALGLAGLLRSLERRFAVLGTGRRDADARHRTLQAALDWSHGLLTPAEQALYRVCGAFAAGFTLELLSAVAQVPGQTSEVDQRWWVVDTLAQLVDRSLVVVEEDGESTRYRLLETMREDARQRLQAQGEEAEVRAHLLLALLAMARRIDGAATQLERRALQASLLADHDNLREAITWGCSPSAAALRSEVVELACQTAYSATFSYLRVQAMRWLEQCEPLAEHPDTPAPLRARWWRERARQWLMSARPEARAMAERALAISRDIGDDHGEFESLSSLVRQRVGSLQEATAWCEAMRALLARHPEWPAVRALLLAGAESYLCVIRGDSVGLLRCRQRELELALLNGDQNNADAAQSNVVFALQDLGRHDEALAQARALLTRMGDSQAGNAAYAWTGLVTSLRALGHAGEFRAVLPRAAQVLRLHGLPLIGPQCALLLAAEGRWEAALQLTGHTRARYVAAGMTMTDEEIAALTALEQQVRAELGDSRADVLLAEGMALDEAAADSLVLTPPLPSSSTTKADGRLPQGQSSS